MDRMKGHNASNSGDILDGENIDSHHTQFSVDVESNDAIRRFAIIDTLEPNHATLKYTDV